MTPGPEDDIPQSEKRRVTLQDADVRNGDTDAYIKRYAPALTARRLPELTPAQKEQTKRRLAEAEQKRGSTYHQFAQAEIDLPRDRFAAINQTQVVGQSTQDPWPKLPENSPWSGRPADFVEYRDASAPSPLDMRPRRSLDPEATSTARDRFESPAPYIVGSSPRPWYPPASGQADHSGTEPPLGADNPAFDSSTVHSPVGDTGDPTPDAPARRGYKNSSSKLFEHGAGSPSSPRERDDG